MALDPINLGTAENSGNGDKVRVAFGKINVMFAEIYAAVTALGTHVHAVATSTVSGFMAATDKAKLDAIAPGATANQNDTYLRTRGNHLGEQEITTVTGLAPALAGKAATAHSHVVADTTGLQAALDAKAPLTRAIPAGGTTGQVLAKTSGTDYAAAWSTVGTSGGPTTIADVGGLQAALDAKSATSHTHAEAVAAGASGFLSGADKTRLNGLDAALAGKAATAHTHAIGDTTGLQTTLDAKADAAATTTALAGKASTAHTHTIANTTGLQAALDGKAATVHAHAVADVTGLQAALDAKAATAHTHATSAVTGLDAALAARVRSVPGAQGGTAITNTFVVTQAQYAAYVASPPADHATTDYIILEA